MLISSVKLSYLPSVVSPEHSEGTMVVDQTVFRRSLWASFHFNVKFEMQNCVHSFVLVVTNVDSIDIFFVAEVKSCVELFLCCCSRLMRTEFALSILLMF